MRVSRTVANWVFVVSLTPALLTTVLSGLVLAQASKIDVKTLKTPVQYTISPETWPISLKRGFQWVFHPEALAKTLPFFAYKSAQINELCHSPDIDRRGDYDLRAVDLVHHGSRYYGFPLGGDIDPGVVKIVAGKAAAHSILTNKEYDVGTKFDNAVDVIDDFEGQLTKFKSTATSGTDVLQRARKFHDVWIPSSPAAQKLVDQMIAKTATRSKRFKTEGELSNYWKTEAAIIKKMIDTRTEQSANVLQYVVNAAKPDHHEEPRLTVNKVCGLNGFVASHRENIGDSLLFATKRWLPKVPYEARLFGSATSPRAAFSK